MQLIYSGYYQTCSYLHNYFRCWGSNKNGEADLSSLKQNEYIIYASIGRHYLCTIHNPKYNDAIRGTEEFGDAYCMGNNEYHQTEVPEVLTEGNKVETIKAGDYHTCATGNVDAMCWGRNDTGQLEIPSEKKSLVASISVRWLSTCVVSNNVITCFGKFKYDELYKDSQPIKFALIELGYNHVCYNLNRVVCEGENEYGQLNKPSNSVILNMSTYGDHTCAADYASEDPINKCWGRNDQGQSDLSKLTVQSFNFVTVGEKHSCFVKGKTYVECIGTDKLNLNKVPNFVKNDIHLVETGGNFSCAIQGGQISCYGKGHEKLNKNIPSDQLHNSLYITTGFNHICSSYNKLALNAVYACWSSKSKENSIIQPPSILQNAKIINNYMGSGYKFSCTSLKYHSNLEVSYVVCWGINDHGQQDIPQGLVGPGSEHVIGAGIAHACATTLLSQLVCWGKDDKGQATIPSTILTDISMVGCGYYHTCAVNNKDQGKCWGLNHKGQVDIPKNLMSELLIVVGGGDFSCGIRQGYMHRVLCWGGSGMAVPKQWASGLNKVSAGLNHACLVNERGNAKCWGDDEYGQSSWIDN